MPASDAATWCSRGANYVTLTVLARPGSARRRIVGGDPRGLVVALTSHPDKGKANQELIALVAEAAHVPRSAVAIVRGATARQKTIRISTADPAQVAALIAAAATVK
jgi:uncharacterized protein